MTVAELQQTLARVPEPEPAPIDDELIAGSVRYLDSDAAARSLDADTYWPKWDSPWWHMLLLHELGEARRIPARIVALMIERVNALPLHIFPIQPEDSPPGTDPYRDSSCHCALGCLHQVLTACGVDVAAALPWIEPWFARYQMADGGASCDDTAYLSGECASSMVATIAPLEAMLARPPGDFLDRAAGFLALRQLTNGSPSRHNAAEREAAPKWLLPCFPRFYFYDVLRGLAALVRWAELRDRPLPLAAVAGAASHLAAAFPDGVVRPQRRGYAGTRTMARVDGAWVRGQPASVFPLLDATSAIGLPAPALTRQWSEARAGLLRLAAAGRLTD
ncbi:MAG TPA: hypothetical protein VNO30_49950 [Kofleriaceae bacterium]|nr:hypothetical protein [Kofleriaceae bacterium]